MGPVNHLVEAGKKSVQVLGLSGDNVQRAVTQENLVRYQSKLLPLIPQEFYERRFSQESNGEERLNRLTRSYDHALELPLVSVTNLAVQPGDHHFLVWLFVSSYFPVLAACMAPLGNLISFVGLLEHWRRVRATDRLIIEEPPVIVLNGLAFGFGILGNVSLLMNFSGKMKYLITQLVSIFSWIVAATALLVGALLTNATVIGPDPKYKRSEGFWIAVFTVFMYYSCAIIITINFIGYWLDKYPPQFNLDNKQRKLMVYTILFSVWQAIGTVIMRNLIKRISYGAALYYCVVSTLTVGLGDITPLTTGAKVFAMVFSFVGLVTLGLLISMIRQVELSSANASIFWHLSERRRTNLLNKMSESDRQAFSYAESFEVMLKVRRKALLTEKRYSLFILMLVFLVFWLTGALAFHVSEGWNYFDAIYFCFMCFITVGYGDFAPASPFGRMFFVQWAIIAVPLMTTLVSIMSDDIFEHIASMKRLCKKVCILALGSIKLWGTPVEHPQNTLDDDIVRQISKDELLLDNEGNPKHGELLKQKLMAESVYADFELMIRFLRDAIEEPEKSYDLAQWTEIVKKLAPDASVEQFWLSQNLPLRLPMKQPNFLLNKMLVHIGKELRALVKAQQEFLDDDSGVSLSVTNENESASLLK